MRLLKLVSLYDANTGTVTTCTSGSYCNATFAEKKQRFGLRNKEKAFVSHFSLEPGLAVRQIPQNRLKKYQMERGISISGAIHQDCNSVPASYGKPSPMASSRESTHTQSRPALASRCFPLALSHSHWAARRAMSLHSWRASTG